MDGGVRSSRRTRQKDNVAPIDLALGKTDQLKLQALLQGKGAVVEGE